MTMHMGKEIKSCPNCESKDIFISERPYFDFLRCQECYYSSEYYDGHPEDAIASWNKKKRNKNIPKLEIFQNKNIFDLIDLD